MSDELKKSAEWILSLADPTRRHAYNAQELFRHAAVFANHYLATLDAAGDGEVEVDEEWLKSVGLDCVAECYSITTNDNTIAYLASVKQFFINNRGIHNIKTRGQVRQLLRALGIEGKDRSTT